MKKIKIYVITGEASGDLIAYNLIHSMKKVNPNVEFVGIGGSYMMKLGFQSFIDIKHLSVMGFVEIITKIPFFKKLINSVVDNIILHDPDLVITVDAPGFNNRVINLLRQKSKKHISCLHYVAPSVWAWKKSRAKSLAKLYDYLFCLLDFEPHYFTRYALPSFFIGHPVIETNFTQSNPITFLETYKIPKNLKYVLLMPGSRLTEINKLLPIFLQVAAKLNNSFSNLHFLIPCLPYFKENIVNFITNSKENIELENFSVINHFSDKFASFQLASLAIVASGTVTLELALNKINTIVTYKVNPITAFLVKRLIYNLKYASLINIMSDKPLIKELIQQDCNVDNIYSCALDYLTTEDIKYDERILTILERLGYNKFKPSEKAAELVVQLVEKGQMIT